MSLITNVETLCLQGQKGLLQIFRDYADSGSRNAVRHINQYISRSGTS